MVTVANTVLIYLKYVFNQLTVAWNVFFSLFGLADPCDGETGLPKKQKDGATLSSTAAATTHGAPMLGATIGSASRQGRSSP
jgi:hypothetical protein